MNKFKKQMKNEKGLTLIELLAVIVILAVIAAIAIPSIGNIIENSKYNAVKADALNVLSAANMYFVDSPDKADVTIAILKSDGFLDSAGKITDGTVTKATTTATSNAFATTTPVTYSGTKTVSFTAATVKLINDDTQKGSAAGNKTVPGGTPTVPES